MISHFEEIYDIQHFDNYDNFYTIADFNGRLWVIYGHFFDDYDLFVYRKMKDDEMLKPYVDEYNKCSVSCLRTPQRERFYRFSSYEAAKWTLAILSAYEEDDDDSLG